MRRQNKSWKDRVSYAKEDTTANFCKQTDNLQDLQNSTYLEEFCIMGYNAV
jgi:hypothetical protein